MASKPAVKTYSRASREAAQSKAFDDALKPNAGGPTASQTKWGKTSFSRLREDDPFEVTYKKVKIETESSDPFSFDFEDGEVKKEVAPAPVNVPPPSASGGLGRPAIPNIKVTQKEQRPEADVPMEEDEDDVPLSNFKQRPVRTYSRKKKDDSQQGSTQEEREEGSSRDVFADSPEPEDPFGGSRGRGKRTYTRKKHQNVPRMITSKTHVLHSEEDSEEGLTVLNFRSHYMDPAVYSQFKYTQKSDDPVGRLDNSKVLQKSEIKHAKGSTVIVVCSPKVPPVPGLKSYLKEKPRGPNKPVEEEPMSCLNQASNLAEAAELANQEIKNLNQNINASAFELTEESSDLSSAAPVPPRSFTRKTKPNVGGGTVASTSVRKNRIFKSKNRLLNNDDVKEESYKEETPPPPLQNEYVVAEKEKTSQNMAENSFGFDSGDESEMPDIVGKAEEPDPIPPEFLTAPLVETPEEPSITESQETIGSPMEEGNSSQELLSSSQGSIDSSQDSAKVKEPVRERKIFRSKNSRVAELQKKPSLQKVILGY